MALHDMRIDHMA